jgi:hypothetical protein
MKLSFDTDTILFTTVNVPAIKSAVTGGIYLVDRPTSSKLIDIVVNTITLTQDSLPQIGTSNINIHVPDLKVTIGGVQQNVADTAKLQSISLLVVNAIRNARIPGLKMSVESQNILAEADVAQHFVNIRITWNIQQ